MPVPSFPKEVTDLIVDELGWLPRSECLKGLLACSTAHSSFTKACQKHIFRDVTLALPPAVFSPLDQNYEVYEPAMLFVEAVTANPGLLPYVRNLNLRTTINPTAGRNKTVVLSTIELLSSVTSLRVAEDLRGTEEAGDRARLDQDTAAVIASLLLHSQLRSLTLINIYGYPVEFITLGAYLDTFSVFHSSIGKDTDYPQLPPPRHPHGRHTLKALSCSTSSLDNGNTNFCDVEKIHHTSMQNIFSSLESMDISFWDPYQSLSPLKSTPIVLLGRAQSLKTLKIKCELSLPSIGTYKEPLLQRLNPLSFATLSHLTYSLIYELLGSIHRLEDPYYGLAGPLAGFTQLQSLQINLVFTGDLYVDWDIGFGLQWGKICATLASPDVSVLVHVLALTHPALGFWTPQPINTKNAERFRQQVFESVYPAQFQSLIELDAVGALNFSFAVRVSAGPYAQLVDGI